ncbi:MAG: UDP-3-O-(3-hydroxymyristoyl)glucosamine N-acyltransferase [Nitrospirota bacterium]
MKLQALAELLGGELRGNGNTEIWGVSGASDAKEGDITFLAGMKWLKEVKGSSASAVLVKEFVDEIAKPQLKTGNPQYAFAKLLSHFYVRPHPCKGISSRAFISEKASIGQDVTIYDFAYIADGVRIGAKSVVYPGVFIGEDSTVGEGCTIHPNTTIRERVTIGSNVVIHSGAVIGADGFGYVFEGGVHHKIPQVGTVVIEDDVEIGAGVTIDRATTGTTRIGRGTKIDNLVQVGHNVQVGRNVILVAQIGIGGSSHIGDHTIIGGQAGIADHTTIAPGTMIGAQSGVLGEVQRGIYSGSPIMPHRDWLKASAVFARLPELKKKIEELEKSIRTIQSPEEQ